jgi:hypothetical protein
MITFIVGIVIGFAGGYVGHDKIVALIAKVSGTPPAAS